MFASMAAAGATSTIQKTLSHQGQATAAGEFASSSDTRFCYIS
jgi:hypothetical protein